MSMIDERVVQRIIERADIVDVVGDYLTLHRKGKDYVALCPFHDDSSPSLQISTAKNICKCFACGEGGTPVSFIMKYEHLTFPEAIKFLGRKYGIEVVERELSPEQMARKTEREKLINANAFARDEFVGAMLQGAEGRRIGLSYFRERGLTDETIKEFQLGYSPSEWTYLVDRAKESGVELEVLDSLGLVMKTKKGDYIDRYRERVIFPIHSSSGNVVGFGGRILKRVENVGKYINSPASELYDKSNELYGLFFAKKYISSSDKCIVLEGYMDVLSMYQRGVRNVVASSGTALTHAQVAHIKRLTQNVTLLFDADGAGIKAALRGLDICLEAGLGVKVLLLPDGEDPDSFAQSHTKEDIEAYFREHEEDGIAFKGERLVAEYGTDPQGKVAIIEELAQTIAYIEARITRELYIGVVAEQWEVTAEALGERVKRIREERNFNRTRRERSAYLSPQEATPQQGFTNLSTKAISGQVAPKVASPRVKDPLPPYELTLLHDIIDYGTVLIPGFSTGEEEVEITGLQLIHEATQDLRDMEGVEGLSDHFMQILDRLMDAVQLAEAEGAEVDLTRLLIGSEDDTIREYADRYLIDKCSLSPRNDKFIKEMEEPEELGKLLMRDVLSLKLHKIEEQIQGVLGKIRAMGSENVEEYKELYEELKQLSEYKSNASQLLGDRIYTPSLLLKK
ncbi:DNA primase [uncultured Porphyromonas sp.]|uniref:DNA primase n=1 Tax=uncultured Porphyromonas sp. TaxID=159274 RepID=UPI0026388592|nr:DNA primase [uncultured Porphyromonas sp.]